MLNFSKIQQYELTNTDLKNLVGNIPIIKYPNLSKYSNINTALGDNGAFILFFETTSKNVGHWQMVFRLDNGFIEFFDSYGLYPSADQDYISQTIAIKLKESKQLLPQLLDKAIDNGQNVIYNRNDYQSWKGNVGTCGRHIATRLLHRHLNERQYYEFLTDYMKQNKLYSFDEAVCLFTYNIIHK